MKYKATYNYVQNVYIYCFEFIQIDKKGLIVNWHNWLNTKFIKVLIYKCFCVMFIFKLTFEAPNVLFKECPFGFRKSVVLVELRKWFFQETINFFFGDVLSTCDGKDADEFGFPVTQVFDDHRCWQFNVTIWETGFWEVDVQSWGWPFTLWGLFWI